MSSKRCCVPQCAEIEDSQRVLHWFPNPEKDIVRFRTWVHAIGGDILSLSNENIYKLRRVCHAHFEEKYCCRNNRISNIAIPTLLMPGPLSISKCIYTDRKLFREVENLPSTSKGSLSLPESRKPLKENEKPSQGPLLSICPLVSFRRRFKACLLLVPWSHTVATTLKPATTPLLK